MIMNQDNELWRTSGSRRRPRPQVVTPCPLCHQPAGTSYPTCPTCYQTIELFWLADWQVLLEREQVQPGSENERLLAEVVMVESERHPWTVVDIAMTLLICPECGNELGSRYQECTACYLAFGQALASEYGVTGNEHALHIGRWILRHPHQHSQNILTAWRGSVPQLLTGWLPTTAEAQRGMAQIKRGKATDH